MRYEKRSDALPIMEYHDQVPDRLEETNTFRRHINRHHAALGEHRNELDALTHKVSILMGMVILLMAAPFLRILAQVFFFSAFGWTFLG